MDADDFEALAAEYVLGTLDADDRRAAEARIAADPDFRAAVAAWAAELQPLADGVPPVAPNVAVFGRIQARIDAERPSGSRGNVVALRRSIRRWQIGAFAAGAVAAALLAVVILDSERAPETQFVAMLTPDGGKPAFVVTVDTVKSTLSIRRIAAAAPSGKSYELWAVPNGASPKSLGVVEQATYIRQLPYGPEDLTLAVSLEPAGGSTTGAPTGPVVFSGPLLKSE